MPRSPAFQQLVADIEEVAQRGQTIDPKALLQHVEKMEEDADVSLEFAKQNHANRLAEWQQTETNRLAHTQALWDGQRESFRALIEASKTALTSTILVNGGAAVAILAFIGNMQSKVPALSFSPKIISSLMSFAAGVFFGAFATGLFYLTQFLYSTKWQKSAKWSHAAAIAVVLLSYGVFVLGVVFAGNAFGASSPSVTLDATWIAAIYDGFKTLVATFLGAALAFAFNRSLDSRKRARADKATLLTAAIVLRFQRQEFRNYRAGFLESLVHNYKGGSPNRDLPLWPFVKPLHMAFASDEQIEVSKLVFLADTNRQLLVDKMLIAKRRKYDLVQLVEQLNGFASTGQVKMVQAFPAGLALDRANIQGVEQTIGMDTVGNVHSHVGAVLTRLMNDDAEYLSAELAANEAIRGLFGNDVVVEVPKPRDEVRERLAGEFLDPKFEPATF